VASNQVYCIRRKAALSDANAPLQDPQICVNKSHNLSPELHTALTQVCADIATKQAHRLACAYVAVTNFAGTRYADATWTAIFEKKMIREDWSP